MNHCSESMQVYYINSRFFLFFFLRESWISDFKWSYCLHNQLPSQDWIWGHSDSSFSGALLSHQLHQLHSFPAHRPTTTYWMPGRSDSQFSLFNSLVSNFKAIFLWVLGMSCEFPTSQWAGISQNISQAANALQGKDSEPHRWRLSKKIKWQGRDKE